jgi:hypothetical protein
MKRETVSRGSVIAAVAVALLLVSLAVPAVGGPNAVSAVSALKLAKKALKKANAADRRSKQALMEAQTPGPAGPRGPAGPAGVQGPSGSNAFGSLTYVLAAGTTDIASGAGYAFADAACPAGTAPTGGSGEFTGGEPAPPGPLGSFLDSGSYPDDLNGDGFYETWTAYVYNTTAGATVYSSAVCAPAGSAYARARPRDPRAERLRRLARPR